MAAQRVSAKEPDNVNGGRTRFRSSLVVVAVGLGFVRAVHAANPFEPFSDDDRLVATYYVNAYVDGTSLKRHALDDDAARRERPAWTWKPHYPTGTEPGAEPFGLHDTKLWPSNRMPSTAKWPDSDDYLYHVAELRSMKWAGVDFVFVELWWPDDFADAARAERGRTRDTTRSGEALRSGHARPDRELDALFRAWRYLDQRGEKPVKLSFILATPAFAGVDVRGEAPGDTDALFAPTWAFYRQFIGENKYDPPMPRRALATIRDRGGRLRFIGNLFLPRAVGMPGGDWITRWDESTFATLRTRFESLTGFPLYICVTQNGLGAEHGAWNGPQAGASQVDISRRSRVIEQEIAWHAALDGPCVLEDTIAIGAGYFRARSPADRPGGNATHEDGSPRYPGAYRFLHEDDKSGTYEQQWRQVLASPENFKKHLLVIESWNALAVGSQVSPSEPAVRRDANGRYIDRWGDTPTMYLDMTRRYVSLWKGDAKP